MAQRKHRGPTTRGRGAKPPWWRAFPSAPLGVGLVLVAGLVVVIALFLTSGHSSESQVRPGTAGPPRDSPLPEGAAAPAVVLPMSAGGTFNLADYRGKSNVLIYFYEHAG